MAKKEQKNEVFDAVVFVLSVIGWICVIQLAMVLFFGIAWVGPFFWLR